MPHCKFFFIAFLKMLLQKPDSLSWILLLEDTALQTLRESGFLPSRAQALKSMFLLRTASSEHMGGRAAESAHANTYPGKWKGVTWSREQILWVHFAPFRWSLRFLRLVLIRSCSDRCHWTPTSASSWLNANSNTWENFAVLWPPFNSSVF